ncbi:MAG TPA: LamG domain-containing protein [Kofleriaceae bacterium]|jgi:hypothetical protein|nr:LamG domain-containing protein [Kofleriaceae bacterium]
MRAWWLLMVTACGRIHFDSSDASSVAGDAADAVDSVALPATPFAFWSFNEASGTTAADSSGNGHALMLVNGTTWTTGIAGTGVHTNGTNQYLVSMSPLDLSPTSAVTVSLWMRFAYGGATVKNVVELTPNFNAETIGLGLFVDDVMDCSTSNIGVGVIGNLGGSAGCYVNPGSLTWHHLVAVYDKSLPGCCETALYIDGVAQTEMPTFNSDNSNSFGVATLYLLSRGGTTSFASADLDELAIFSRALTPAEIASF